MVKSVRTDRNSKIHTGGAENYRTTNYRKSTYVSDMKTSAGTQKPERRNITLKEKNTVGYVPEVKQRTDKKSRYSLRYSFQDTGTALSFKRAKAQKESRNIHNSEVWEHDRLPWVDPNVEKTRAPIQINNPDSRKELIKYLKKKLAEEEAFQAQLEKELEEEFGDKKETESSSNEESSEEESSSSSTTE